MHPDGVPSYLSKDAELMVGDVANREDLGRALEGVDHVVHLAAYQDYMPDFSTFIHVNAESTALLFELIVERRLEIARIVFASSQSVAGEGWYECAEHGWLTPPPRPLEQLEAGEWEVRCPHCGEAMKPGLIPESVAWPHTSYAISKHAIEQLARSLGGRYGIPTACMRYTYVQGARNSFYNAYSGICRIFALRVRAGLPPVCYEDGAQLRDYVNVKDVAQANLLALLDPTPGARVLNVGGGRAVTVLEFARILLEAAGSDLEPEVPGLFRVGDTRHTVSDITAMRSLGWSPSTPVEENVRQYLEWFERFEGSDAYLREAERIMAEQGVVRRARAKTGRESGR